MYSSWIVGAVDALDRELQYYKKISQEQAEVIEQLHRGYPLPGKPVYIHPYDLMVLMQEASPCDVCFQYSISSGIGYQQIKGISYKQSVHMPQIAKEA